MHFSRCLARATALAGLLLTSSAPGAAAADPVVDLETATVAGLQADMAAGRLTAEQLTRLYVNRIAALNARGPGLNAVRKLNPDALADAKALDAERKAPGERGPLHGIPVLLKDNVDVKGMPTTAGSAALESSVPSRDSFLTTKLRKAGAVILGKANLTEFANFFGAGMPGGYSSLGGQVLNAYDADLNPSGSSSGSASAAAAGLAAITIGTETSGSIISPAAAQGVVGLRPTVGLVSRTGILPISDTQDTAGPITRTVADAAAELQAVAGKDAEDTKTASAPADVPDYLGALKPEALAGKRVGVTNATDENYVAAVAKLRDLGATAVTIDVTAPSIPSITSFEFKRDLNAYLSRLPADAPRKTLADILDYADLFADEEKKFGYQRADEAQDIDLSDPAVNATYVTARDSGQKTARDYIDGLLSRGTADRADDLDVVMTPSGTLTGTGARAGYPQLVVPAGYTSTQRRPVGVSFAGTAYSEKELLAYGFAYEQGAKLRKPPSEINPALYRCATTTPASRFGAHSCAPGRELLKLVGDEPALGFSLETTQISDLQRRMMRGTLSAETLTKAYLARIARTNTEGPSINAVRIVNPDALADARRLDAERAAGRIRGPMHGIPILLKDNIDVAGLPTTAGALALEKSFPKADSPLAATLRERGAIILGKTNLSEFANFYSTSSVSGYSGLGGQVLTPVDLDRNPSGSSSGSAAAASAGLAAATIGSETSGSIISPAAAQGVVGLRPTVGLVPRSGIIPISASQDTAGPMTQTVYDAAAELGAMAAKDPEDPETATQPPGLSYDFVSGLSPTALQGKRIGVVSPPVANADEANYRSAIARVQALGATTVPITSTPPNGGPSILAYEFKRDLNAYFGRLGDTAPIKSLAQVIAFNTANADEAIKLGQGLLTASEAINLEDPTTKQTYQTNRDTGRTNTRNAINTDLTRGTPATTDDLAAILTPSGTYTGTGARAGYPQLTIPAGYDAAGRNPVNISFVGGAYSEAQLLALGYAFEQATQARKAPSETNPASWRCVPGSLYGPRSCPPGDPLPAPQEPAAPGGGAVPGPAAPGPAVGTAPGARAATRPVIRSTALTAVRKGRTVLVRLACSVTVGDVCRGELRLESGTVVLGRRTFSITADKPRSVKVTLTRSAYRKLVLRKRLRVNVVVLSRSADGRLRRAVKRVTLKAPGPLKAPGR